MSKHMFKYTLLFQLPVSLYYESLCPGSAEFVTVDLYPTITGPLGKYVKLELVPFGNAHVSPIDGLLRNKSN